MAKKTKMVVKLNVRPIWQIGKGHTAHRGGAGTHDSRPNRGRTRGDATRRAIRDYV